MLRKIIDILGDADALTENLYQDDPRKIRRLDAVSTKVLGAGQLPRPATPLPDAALMTNARNEPTLAAELRVELGSAVHVDCYARSWLVLVGTLTALVVSSRLLHRSPANA